MSLKLRFEIDLGTDLLIVKGSLFRNGYLLSFYLALRGGNLDHRLVVGVGLLIGFIWSIIQTGSNYLALLYFIN